MFNRPLDFRIDKLTNSIENVFTGDSFNTEISLVLKEDLKNLKGWLFDWDKEFEQADREVYKLTIVNNAHVVQGLISLAVRVDHVYMHLIESAPFNLGRNKIYAGVAGNMVAFACRLSFQRGCEGYVSFTAKTRLVDHYADVLGANHVHGGLMIISTEAALRLTSRYFKT